MKCIRCGKRFNPEEVEREYDEDDYIVQYNLQGSYYSSAQGRCLDCAVQYVCDVLPQGLEDLRWLGELY